MEQPTQPPAGMPGFNAPALFSKEQEKSWLGKLLSEKELVEIEEIIKRPQLTRVDCHELMFKTNALESKLGNTTERERAEIASFLDFLGGRIKMMDLVFDAVEEVELHPSDYSNFKKRRLYSAKYRLSHDLKYLFTVFTYPTRSSMSVDAFAIKQFVKNAFEFKYEGFVPNFSGEQKKGFLGLGGSK